MIVLVKNGSSYDIYSCVLGEKANKLGSVEMTFGSTSYFVGKNCTKTFMAGLGIYDNSFTQEEITSLVNDKLTLDFDNQKVEVFNLFEVSNIGTRVPATLTQKGSLGFQEVSENYLGYNTDGMTLADAMPDTIVDDINLCVAIEPEELVTHYNIDTILSGFTNDEKKKYLRDLVRLSISVPNNKNLYGALYDLTDYTSWNILKADTTTPSIQYNNYVNLITNSLVFSYNNGTLESKSAQSITVSWKNKDGFVPTKTVWTVPGKTIADNTPSITILPTDFSGNTLQVSITQADANGVSHSDTITIIKLTYSSSVSKTIRIINLTEYGVDDYLNSIGYTSIDDKYAWAKLKLRLYDGKHLIQMPRYSLGIYKSKNGTAFNTSTNSFYELNGESLAAGEISEFLQMGN